MKEEMVSLIIVGFLLTTSFLALQNAVHVSNASAVTSSSSSIGVYWDSKATLVVSTINWGNVSVNSEKDMTVYVKNLGQETLVFSISTTAWNPSALFLKMYVCWNYNLKPVAPGAVVKVALRLFVTPSAIGSKSFSFSLNVGVGLNKSPDVNSDGLVNILDLTTLTAVYATTAGDLHYYYLCDINNDGVINILDLSAITSAYLP